MQLLERLGSLNDYLGRNPNKTDEDYFRQLEKFRCVLAERLGVELSMLHDMGPEQVRVGLKEKLEQPDN